MKRIVTTAMLASVIVIGGWALMHHDRINSLDDAFALVQQQIGGRGSSQPAPPDGTDGFVQWQLPAVANGGDAVPAREAAFHSPGPRPANTRRIPPNDRIRIGTFDMNSLSAMRTAETMAMQTAVAVLMQFDVIALQRVEMGRSDIVNTLTTELTRTTGRRWRCEVSGATNNDPSTWQRAAFIYDSSRIAAGESSAVLVSNPDRIFVHAPFIAWFTVAGVDRLPAFTFTLVNIDCSETGRDLELDSLGSLFQVVRDSQRGEDDVIIAGNFSSSTETLKRVLEKTGLVPVIPEGLRNTDGTSQKQNILISQVATTEYLGASGAFDIVRAFNLYIAQSSQVTPSFPVWAEFSFAEGGLVKGFPVPLNARRIE